MTSSLVGSEMCIRDRAFLRRRGTNIKFAHQALKCPGLKHTVFVLTQATRCLLYTSDAADDM
eukprot:3494062-Prorocentrum_lima.AAC.1